MTQLVKNQPAMRETYVWSLGWEDPLEKGLATHCSILAWRILFCICSDMGLAALMEDKITETSMKVKEVIFSSLSKQVDLEQSSTVPSHQPPHLDSSSTGSKVTHTPSMIAFQLTRRRKKVRTHPLVLRVWPRSWEHYFLLESAS